MVNQTVGRPGPEVTKGPCYIGWSVCHLTDQVVTTWYEGSQWGTNGSFSRRSLSPPTTPRAADRWWLRGEAAKETPVGVDGRSRRKRTDTPITCPSFPPYAIPHIRSLFARTVCSEVGSVRVPRRWLTSLPLLLSHEIDGVRKEKERLTAAKGTRR